MSRYLVGLGAGTILMLLLGAAGDDAALDKRVKSLESSNAALKAQVDTLNSRILTLEGRLAILEKRLGDSGRPVAPDSAVGSTTPPDAAGGATSSPDDPAAALRAFVAEQDRKRVVTYLRTANYYESQGVPGLWCKTEVGESPGKKVAVNGLARYLGEADLSEFTLSMQVVVRNPGDKVVGTGEFELPAESLKPDKDYTFRLDLQLTETYSPLNKVECKLLRKVKNTQIKRPPAKKN